jgi:hypothetical protein
MSCVTQDGQGKYIFCHCHQCFCHRHLRKIDWLMACTTCPVYLVNTVSGHHKNAIGKGSASSRHIANLSNLLFFRCLCFLPKRLLQGIQAFSHLRHRHLIDPVSMIHGVFCLLLLCLCKIRSFPKTFLLIFHRYEKNNQKCLFVRQNWKK